MHVEKVDAKFKLRMQIAFKLKGIVTVNFSLKLKEIDTVLFSESSILCIIELSECIQHFTFKRNIWQA